MDMNHDEVWGQSLTNRTIGHGLCVLFIGLIAGLPLAFSLLQAVTLWLLPVWDIQIPGSPRGWASAHVGGILNGVMICGIAMLATRLAVKARALNWVCYGMIFTMIAVAMLALAAFDKAKLNQL